MSAPARPTAGAFATVHLVDMGQFIHTISFLIDVAQAPTRTGADIFSNHDRYSELP